MVTVLAENLLSTGAEAKAVGRADAVVSRHRRDKPDHPAYRRPDGTFAHPATEEVQVGPHRVYVLAPRDAVEAYWAAKPRGGGRPRTADPIPDGQTRDRWTAFCWLVQHGTPLSTASRRRLFDAGLVTEDGQPTDAGRSLHNQFPLTLTETR